MIRLPPELLRKQFDGNLCRGALIRFPFDKTSDPARVGITIPKFGVVLNVDCSSESIDIALTTSRLEAYADGRWDRDILRIKVGNYECFSKETILNLREVYSFEREALFTFTGYGSLSFEGNLRPVDIETVDRSIRASKLLSLRTKRRILPDAVQALSGE